MWMSQQARKDALKKIRLDLDKKLYLDEMYDCEFNFVREIVRPSIFQKEECDD